MGDWRVPALPNKRFEPTPRARMLTPISKSSRKPVNQPGKKQSGRSTEGLPALGWLNYILKY